tara:strand:+ start:7437 stop:7637 length:201 start_codon:yes stop_codon:yes gene_type:complete
MLTRRFAIDRKGKKIYIGNVVKYNNSFFFVEDMHYLSWSTEQYLVLVDRKNKNKKIDFIKPSDVLA